MAQSVRAFALYAEAWVFDSPKSLKQVVCYGSSEKTIKNGCPVSQKLRYGTAQWP